MAICLKEQWKLNGTLNEKIDYIKLHGAASASVYYNVDYIAVLHFCKDPEINKGDDSFGKNAVFSPEIGEDSFSKIARAITERISKMAVEIEALQKENRDLRDVLEQQARNQEREDLPATIELLKACDAV